MSIDVISQPESDFRQKIRLRLITKPDSYSDFSITPEDFSEVNDRHGLKILSVTREGRKNHILDFVLEGYFEDLPERAIQFAELLDYIDYEISDIS